MKGFLLLLNVLVFACIVLLGVAHLRHRPPPPPAILAARPGQPSVNPAGRLDGRDPRPVTAVAAISKDDLFDPQRGEVAAAPADKTAAVTDAQRKKLEQLELLGIVRMGQSHGAIIHGSKLKKRYFTVGDPDDIEGFKLISVDPDANQVTLGAGGREYELKLNRNSKASIQRRAQAQRQEAIVTLSPTPPPTDAATGEAAGQRPTGDRAAAIEQARQRMEEIRRERAARQAQGGQDDGGGDGGSLPPGLRRRSIRGDTAETPGK
jgi:hypothetical protein